MSLRTSANRYAKALFDVALEEKADLDRIDKDLSEMTEILRENTELMRVVDWANVPDAQRRAVMESVLDKIGVAAPVKKLLVLLTEQRKLGRLLTATLAD